MDGISRRLLTDEVFRPHPGSGLPESPSLGPTSEPFERTLSGTAEVLINFVSAVAPDPSWSRPSRWRASRWLVAKSSVISSCIILMSPLLLQATGSDAPHVSSTAVEVLFPDRCGSRILGSMSSRSGVVRRELKGEVEAEASAVLLSLAELLDVTPLE